MAHMAPEEIKKDPSPLSLDPFFISSLPTVHIHLILPFILYSEDFAMWEQQRLQYRSHGPQLSTGRPEAMGARSIQSRLN